MTWVVPSERTSIIGSERENSGDPRRCGMSKSSLELALLLVWLSCCAVYLAVARTFLLTGPQDGFQVFTLTALTFLYGTSWAGMLLVLWSVLMRGDRQLEPGVWLLFSLGITLIGDLVIGALPTNFVIQKPALTIATASMAYVLPTLVRRMSPAWKLVFIALLVAMMLPLIGIVGGPVAWAERLHQWGRGIALISFAVPVTQDVRRGVRRTWLHWIGVLCLVLRVAVPTFLT